MTPIDALAFEDTLLGLTKRTHHCLFTLLALLRKFPHFSEKHTSSDNQKIEMQWVYAALQAAVAQLAERIPARLISEAQQEKESVASDRISFDLR